MKHRLIFGAWSGYYLLIAWGALVFLTVNHYFSFEYGSYTERILSLVGAWIIFLLGLRLCPRHLLYRGTESYAEKENMKLKKIYDGFLNQENPKMYNVAGLNGIAESPKKYSVGEDIKDKERFQTIKLLPKGSYDRREELGEAIVFYNRSDVRSKPDNYAEGVQDTFGLLDALEVGRVAVCSKTNGEFYSEVKKAVYRDDFEERDRYFFPDGTCFFDIKTISFTPRFRR